MYAWQGFIKKYFIAVGVLLHVLFIGLLFVLFINVYHSGYSIPAFSDKAAKRIAVKQPKLYSLLSPLFGFTESVSVHHHYFREINLPQWQGKGASGFFQANIKREHVVNVNSSKSFVNALKQALPGQIIVLAEGEYHFKSARLTLGYAGEQDKPITVMAEKLGTVKLFLKGEGIVVDKPYWHFNNLHLIGQCKKHSQCEHAFHVVGKAKHAHIKNNYLQDFNAMIKVNGIKNDFPDYGKVQANTFFNTSPRKTSNPVTPFDLMHANHWQVSDNFFYDIQKSSGDKVSYIAFFKGGSTHGVFERNLAMCSANLAQQYITVGLSLGGGGSLRQHRRDKAEFEHKAGVIRNNIIMHCASDVGIYLNRAKDSIVKNNTLYNTQGVDVRYSESSALVESNIISGRIKSRDGANIVEQHNLVLSRNFFTNADRLSEYFTAPDIGDFTWNDDEPFKLINHSLSPSASDFCGNAGKKAYLGVYSGQHFCLEALNLKAKSKR